MEKILKKAAAGLCASVTLFGSALPALPEGLSLLAPALTAAAQDAGTLSKGAYFQLGRLKMRKC